MAGDLETKYNKMLVDNQKHYQENKPWHVPRSSWNEKYNEDVGRIKMQYHNDLNPDGSSDARRESTWLGTAGRLALGALMLAPYAGGIARGGMAAAKGLGALGKSAMSNPGATAGLAGQGIKAGAEGVKAGAKAAYNNPKRTLDQILYKGKEMGGTYKDYYGNQLNKARDYFGM
jgi:hypothetical protein